VVREKERGMVAQPVSPLLLDARASLCALLNDSFVLGVDSVDPAIVC